MNYIEILNGFPRSLHASLHFERRSDSFVFICPAPAARRLRAAEPVGSSALLLLVLGILANDHDAALALDDLALLADGLDGRSHFHDASS